MVQVNENKDGGSLPSQTFSDAQQKWQSLITNSRYSNCNMLSAIQSAYINNPYIQNDRLKRISTYPTIYDRDTLEEALKNPRNSEQTLRSASWAFNYMIPTIMKLYFSYSEIPLYKWYLLPDGVDSAKFKKPEFKKEYKLVHDFVKKINPEKTFRNITLKTVREGKSFVEARHEVKNGNVLYSSLHELPSDYCKITSRTSNGWSFSFDFTYFLKAGNSTSQFHPVFEKYYNEMMCYGVKNENGTFEVTNWNTPSGVEVEKLSHNFGTTYIWWRELTPLDIFHVISFDDSDASVIPPFSSSFLDANDLSVYKYLQQELLQLPLSSILTAEVPMSENNKSGNYVNDTRLTPDLIVLFQDMFNSISGSSYTKAFFAPFENYQMHKIDSPTKENIVGDSLANFYSQSGLTSLFTTEKKPSVMQSKIFQKIETQFITKLYDQYIEIMNTIINNAGFKYRYSFKMLGDVFSKDDTIASLQKEVAMGNKAMLLPLLSLNNMSILEADSAADLIDSIGYYGKMEVVASAFNASKDDKKDGRPATKEDKVENDSTAAGIESGSSTNREVGGDD